MGENSKSFFPLFFFSSLTSTPKPKQQIRPQQEKGKQEDGKDRNYGRSNNTSTSCESAFSLSPCVGLTKPSQTATLALALDWADEVLSAGFAYNPIHQRID